MGIDFQEVVGATIALVLACGVVLGTFPLLGGLISSSTLVLDRLLWPLSLPFRPILWRWQRAVGHVSEISLAAQFLVGTVFFYYFIYQIENEQTRLSSLEKILLFTFLVLLLPTLIGIAFWKSTHYRDHFSRILYYHRFVKPIWDWITVQSYALLWLQHVPLLHPVIRALDDVAKRVNHRSWQTFLRSLFFLSLFTLPVKLFPESVYNWLGATAKAFPGLSYLIEKLPQLPTFVDSPWFREPVTILGVTYLYLFDWAATVIVMYFVVCLLAPLEPRNLFQSVAESLQYFVKDRKHFVFTSYFWQEKAGEHVPTTRFPCTLGGVVPGAA